MCGIFGVIAPGEGLMCGEKRMLASLNCIRGGDSVGFWADGKRVRVGVSINEALRNRAIPNDVWDSEVFLGHTRARSSLSGAGTKRNAHPFIYNNICGAHNGYISNWKELIRDEKIPGGNNFTVDSQVVFAMLDMHGESGLEKLEGYGAVWWVDRRQPGVVHLWNDGGTLHLSQWTSDDGGFVSFSSEASHLQMSGSCVKAVAVDASGTVMEITKTSGNLDVKEGVPRKTKVRPTTTTNATWGAQSSFFNGSRQCSGQWYHGVMPRSLPDIVRSILPLIGKAQATPVEKIAVRYMHGFDSFPFCGNCEEVMYMYASDLGDDSGSTRVCHRNTCTAQGAWISGPEAVMWLVKQYNVACVDMRWLLMLRKEMLVKKGMEDMELLYGVPWDGEVLGTIEVIDD